MKRGIVFLLALGVVAGCGEKKDFEYWKARCDKDWKNIFGENDESCSKKEVQEYVKSLGESIE